MEWLRGMDEATFRLNCDHINCDGVRYPIDSYIDNVLKPMLELKQGDAIYNIYIDADDVVARTKLVWECALSLGNNMAEALYVYVYTIKGYVIYDINDKKHLEGIV